MAAYTTIDNPELYFQTKIYTGNGSSSHAITLDGSEDMQPDWVWTKGRNVTYNNQTFDSVRGTTKSLVTNENAAEITISGLTAFGTDGFTLGSDAQLNNNGSTYVAWNWKKTATAGFDIVSYTGNGSNRTISHSLSAVPSMMIVKNRDAAEEWTVYHHKNTSAPATDYLALNTNGATTDSNTRWNDTAPTSSVFTVGTSGVVNANGQKFIAYLFAEKKGYSKFGSYVGNGNADGSFIWTGFKPAFVMTKVTDAADSWTLWDNKRDVDNVATSMLRADTDQVEDTSSSYLVDFISNGFKWRSSDGKQNGSGNAYIYMAFAENPFVTSTGIPTTAR